MRRKALRASAGAAGLLVLLAPMTAWAQDATSTDPTTTTVVDVPDHRTDTHDRHDGRRSVGDHRTPPSWRRPRHPPRNRRPATHRPRSHRRGGTGRGRAGVRRSDSSVSTPARTSTPAVSGAARPAVDQQVTITITSPTDGATVNAGEPLEVTGTVTIGLVGAGVSIVYARRHLRQHLRFRWDLGTG